MATLAALTGTLLWATLAGGSQQYETYEATVAASGPVAQFRFDDAAGSTQLTDSAGSFTASNTGITLGGEGPFGGSKSGSFGGSARATLPADPLKEASAFTAEVWVDWSGGSSYDQPIFDFASSSSNYMYLTPASTASKHPMLFEIHSSSGTASVTATKLGSKSWEYVAVSETSSGTVTLYLNGEPVAEATKATITPASLGNSVPNDYLGGGPLSSSEPRFSGSLSNVAFYTRALTASEVKEHYDDAEFPVNTSPPTISGTAKDGKTLTAKEGSWIGLPVETWKFRWELCNGSGTACTGIPEATGTTFLLGHGDVEHTLRVAVIAKNKTGKEGSATSAPTAVVAAIKPSNLTLPVIGGTSEVGQELTVSDGTWEGSPPTRYTFEWQTCNSAGEKCKANGGTGQIYEPTAAQASAKDTLRAVVTAENSAGSANATSAVTHVVTVGPPRAKAPPTISGTPTEGGKLTASEGSWVGTEPIELKHEWQRCSEGKCSTVATGLSYEPTSSDVGSNLKFVVKAKNAVEETSASATTGVVTGPPRNTELPTISGTATQAGKLTGSKGMWAGTAPIEYQYEWQRCFEGKCSTVATGLSYEPTSSDVGSNLKFVVKAKNAVEEASASATTGVVTGPPRNTELPTISGTATQAGKLTGSKGVWAGTAPIEYQYEWQRCFEGKCSTVATGLSYEPASSDVGSTLKFVVVAENSFGEASASATTGVVTGPPRNTELPTISGTATQAGKLTGSKGVWAGTAPIEYQYEWQRCFEGKCSTVATGLSYEPTSSDVGSTLKFVVVTKNSFGEASASATTGVVTGPPRNAEPPTIIGEATAGQMLSASTGRWLGTEPIEYEYHWQSCDALGEGCLPIEGATGSVYTLAASDVGGTVKVLVTARNGAGSASAESSASAVVAGGTEEAGGPWIEGIPDAGQTLYAFPGALAETEAGELAQLGYQWQRCNAAGEACSNIEGATDSEYQLGDGDIGSTLRVLVDATSESGSVSATTPVTALIGAAFTLANVSTPTVSGVAQSGEVLVAHPGTWSGEGTINYAYQWQTCSEDGSECENIGGATDSDYSLTESDVAQTVRVLITATDANGTFSQPSAATQPIAAASAPSVNEAPMVSGVTQEGHTLTATTGTWSAEGPISYGLQWERCNEEGNGCAAIAGATSSSYVLSKADVGSTLRMLVTAMTSHGASTGISGALGPVISASLTNVSIPTISGSHPGEVLSAEPGMWTVSGPISYSYQWETCDGAGKSCAPITGATASSLRPTAAQADGTIRVLVSASSTWGQATVPSDALTLMPAAVTAPSISGSPIEGEVLAIDPGTWEGGQPLTFNYQWQRCNAEYAACTNIEGATEEAYLLAGEDVGFTLRVLVTAVNQVGETSEVVALGGGPVSSQSPYRLSEAWVRGVPVPDEVLSAEPPVWGGLGLASFSYQWQRCEAEHEDCVDIAGATGRTYELDSEDIGTTVQVLVTTVAAFGEESELAQVPGTVEERRAREGTPEAVIEPSAHGVAVSGETVAAEPGLWSGTEPLAYSYQWQRCNADHEGCVDIAGADDSSYTLSRDDVGFTLQVAVTAKNSFGEATAEGQLGDGPILLQGLPEPSYEPWIEGQAFVGETASAEPGHWQGEEPISFSYQWQRCKAEHEGCLDIAGATSKTYSLSGEDVGSTLEVLVTAKNSIGEEARAASLYGTVQEPAPVSAIAPSISGNAVDGQVLIAEAGSWTGLAPTKYSYQWESCDIAGEDCTALAGADTPYYVLDDGDLGDTIRVTVTAENRYGSAASVSEPTGLIAPGPPIGETPRIRGGNYSPGPYPGETLIAENVEARGTGPISESYKWESCNAVGQECREIEGATSASYSLRESDVGHTTRLTVTYRNALGEDTETSWPTYEARDHVPVDTKVPTISSSDIGLGVGDVVTAQPGIWVGSEPLSYAYQWQLCYSRTCENVEGATEATYTVTDGLGEELRVEVTATNSQGTTNAYSQGSYIYYGEQPPQLVERSQISGDPMTGDALTVSTGGWHGAPTSYSYRWERCDRLQDRCQEITGASEPTLSLTTEQEGGYIRAEVTATNAYGVGRTVSEAVGPVRPIPPVNLELPSITGAAVVGELLTASSGSWTGNTTLSFAGNYDYQWQLCDPAGEHCSDIDEEAARSDSYAPSEADAGSTLRVRVTAFSPNGGAEASAISPATAVLAPATPVSNTTPPSITGNPQDGQSLTAEPGSWSGTPAIVFTYQWERCDAGGANCGDIEGATGSSYEQTRADIGATLEVTVTATNGAGSEELTSEPTGVVAAPGVPTNVTPPELPTFFEYYPGAGEWRVAEPKIAVAGNWTGDPTVSYQWQRCDMTRTNPETGGPLCTNIPGATGLLYAPRPADVGYALQIEEIATNQAGVASATSGPSKETVPVGGVEWTLKPGTVVEEKLGGTYTGAAVVGQTITADSTVIAPYELPVTTTYEFLRDNGSEADTTLQEGPDPSYTIASADLGHEIEVVMRVTVWRADKAIPVDSLTIMLYTHTVEMPPTAESPPVISGQTTAGTELTASDGEWQGGGGPLNYTYQWQQCDHTGEDCRNIESATAATYATDAADVGDTMRVIVTATYEGTHGSAISAPTEPIIAAEAPANTTLPTITGQSTDLQTLTATPGTWAGSEPIAYGYQWESCSPEGTECFPVPEATSASYQLSPGDVGTTLRITVTATNGAGPVTASSSVTAVIGGAPVPVNTALPTATLLGTAAPGATVTTDGGTWENVDLEPTLGALSFQWQRCSTTGTECQDIEDATSETYEVGGEDSGYRLRVVVTAENETGRASSSSSLTATISNTAPETTEAILYTNGALLYDANSEGGEEEQVANCETVDPEASGCVFRHPSIAPDGETIATEVRPPGSECASEEVCPKGDISATGKIAVMNSDGTEARTLPGNGSQPTWAPDGTTLTYTRTLAISGEATTARLYSVNADGSNAEDPTPLPIGTEFSESPTYSPDGSQLAFIGKNAAEEPWGLYIANSDGTDARRFTLGDLTRVDQPEFTANGTAIVFDAVPPPGTFDPEAESKFEPSLSSLYEIDTNGTGLHRLTHDNEEISNPVRISHEEILFTHSSYVIYSYGDGIRVEFRPAKLEIIRTEETTEPETKVIPDDHEVGEIAVGRLAKIVVPPSFGGCTPWGYVQPYSESYRTPSKASYTEANVATQLKGHVSCPTTTRITELKASLDVEKATDTWGVPGAAFGEGSGGHSLVTYSAFPHLTYRCVAGVRKYGAKVTWLEGTSNGEFGIVVYPTGSTLNCNAAGAWRIKTYNESKGRPPSELLRARLGKPRIAGEQAHHIIPAYVRSAKAQTLESYGYACRIPVNAANNGVYLPRAVHGPIHNERYWTWVADQLHGAIHANLACPDHLGAELLLTLTGALIKLKGYPGAPNALGNEGEEE